MWVYYSAIILYFGAEFAKSYALNKGAKIIPNQYAEWDKDATVPGAAPKEPPAENAPDIERKPARLAQEPSKQRQPALVQNASVPPKTKTKKSPGIGTALLGLLLYFISSRKESKTNVTIRPAE